MEMINLSHLENFGELLKGFRKRRGFSQQQVATSIGMHRNAISRWEQGDFLPENKRIVLELVKVLQLTTLEARQLLEASFTALAPLWGVPYQRNPFFTGRQEKLEQLHNCLHTQQNTEQIRSYALYGLGGVGKTQLALEYVYHYALEYTAVFWVRAESIETILTSFLAIAELLQLREHQEADQQHIVVAVQRWLTTHNEWLLIWDNLEDVELLLRYLPSIRQGAVLITTRRRILGTLAVGIEILMMRQEDAMHFLLRRAKTLNPETTHEQMSQFAQRLPVEYAAAEKLVTVMGGLPLALDQAGAYIEETGCGLVGYLRIYEQQRKRLLDRRGILEGDHPHSVVTTVLLAYQQVKSANPAAAELLCLYAFLEADAIPEELVAEGKAYLEPPLQSIATDPYQFDQAIAILHLFSLVNRSPETQTLSVHRLIQAVLKETMEPPIIQQWIERTIRMLDAAFPHEEEAVETWPQCQRYLTHIEICADLIGQQNISLVEAGHLLHQSGVYLRTRAQYTQAERWLCQSRDIYLHIGGPEHLAVAANLNDLALLYDKMGRYEEAKALFLNALQIREHLLGPEHPDVAASLNALAGSYWEQGKYEQAEPLFQRAFSLWERQLGPDHILVAHCLNDLALMYWSWGRSEQIEPLYLRALSIHEQQPGPDHPDMAGTLNNLALYYVDQERYEEAEQFYQRALGIWECHLGPEHPDTITGISSLAKMYAKQEQFEKAEPLFLRALQIREHHLGPEHPDTAICLNNLAKIYTRQARYEEAEPFFLRALQIRKHHLGLEHPYVATTLHSLAMMYARQARYEEAEPLFLQALQIRERHLVATHSNTIESLNELAALCTSMERYKEAEMLFLRALTLQEQSLGLEHLHVAATLTSLESLYATQGLDDQKKAASLRSVAIYRKNGLDPETRGNQI